MHRVLGLGLSLLATHAVYAAAPAAHRDAILLHQHHEWVTQSLDPKASVFEVMGGKGDEVVTLDPKGRVFVSHGGPTRVAQHADLLRLQLHTPSQLSARLDESMVRIAKVAGDPTHPDVVTKARQVLSSQLENATALQQWMNAVSTHPLTLQLLLDRKQTNRSELVGPEPARLSLFGDKHQSLVVQGEFGGRHLFSWSRQFHQPGTSRFFGGPVVVTHDSPDGKETSTRATLADLHRYGITTMAKLEQTLFPHTSLGPNPHTFDQRAARVALLDFGASDDADLALLMRYVARTNLHWLPIAGDHTFAVALHSEHLGKLVGVAKGDHRGSGWQPLQLGDFDWVGVDSIASMKAKFAKTLVELAALPGDASDPAVVAKARHILEAQIDNWIAPEHRSLYPVAHHRYGLATDWQ